MNGHLSDEQWQTAVLGEGGEAATNHLQECPACAGEARSFSDVVGRARAEILRIAERPEAFWQQQRAAITNRLAAHEPSQPWKRWAWGAATVTLVILATTLLSQNKAPSVQKAQADSDNALLLSVQQSIESDLPRALQPAALLTEEIDRAAATRRNP